MTSLHFVCPACGGALADQAEALRCAACGRSYPILFGIPDLRLTGDRYLSLEADRERAAELHAAAEKGMSFDALLHFYWERTEKTPASIAARHIDGVRRSVEESRVMISALAGGRLLDVGCGAAGALVAAAQSRGFADVFGVDSALRWLVLARQRLRETGTADAVKLAAASAEALPFSEGVFDAVLLRHVLEHVGDPAEVIAAAARVLVPRGRLGIETFHRWAPTPEPHVGLLGVAWLPRKLQRAYVRWRTGDDYGAISLPSRREVLGSIRRLRLDFRGFLFGPVTAGQRASVSPRLRPLLPIYTSLARTRWGRRLLSHVGPILRLTAVKSPP